MSPVARAAAAVGVLPSEPPATRTYATVAGDTPAPPPLPPALPANERDRTRDDTPVSAASRDMAQSRSDGHHSQPPLSQPSVRARGGIGGSKWSPSHRCSNGAAAVRVRSGSGVWVACISVAPASAYSPSHVKRATMNSSDSGSGGGSSFPQGCAAPLASSSACPGGVCVGVGASTCCKPVPTRIAATVARWWQATIQRTMTVNLHTHAAVVMPLPTHGSPTPTHEQ